MLNVVLLAIFDTRNGQYILERNAIIFSLGKLHLCGLLAVSLPCFVLLRTNKFIMQTI